MGIPKKLIYGVIPEIFDHISKCAKYSSAADTDSQIDEDDEVYETYLPTPRRKPVAKKRTKVQPDEEVTPEEHLWKPPTDDKDISPYEREYQLYKKLHQLGTPAQQPQQDDSKTLKEWTKELLSGWRHPVWRLETLGAIKALAAEEKILQAQAAWHVYKKNEPMIRYLMGSLRPWGYVKSQSPIQLLVLPQTDFERALSTLIFRSLWHTPYEASYEDIVELRDKAANELLPQLRPIVNLTLKNLLQLKDRKTRDQLNQIKLEEERKAQRRAKYGVSDEDLYMDYVKIHKRVSRLREKLLKEQQKK